jgi:hypothetical protein
VLPEQAVAISAIAAPMAITNSFLGFISVIPLLLGSSAAPGRRCGLVAI